MASHIGTRGVVQLLCDAGADKDQTLQDGATALMMASQRGHREVVELLCESGADKDLKRQDGATAMMLASLNRHQELALVLYEAGAHAPVRAVLEYLSNLGVDDLLRMD